MKSKKILLSGLFAASAFLFSADKRNLTTAEKLERDPIAYLMSDEYKAQIFDELIHGSIPDDALAQPDISTSTAGEVDLEKSGFALMMDIQLAMYEDSVNAGLVFNHHGQRYKVKAADLIDMEENQKRFLKEIKSDLEPSVIITPDLPYKVSCMDDGHGYLQIEIDPSSFVYFNKKGLLGASAHEVAHTEDEPFPKAPISRDDSLKITRKNEIRADKRAAGLTSPAHMEAALYQVATSLQDDARAMPASGAAMMIDNKDRFGFTVTPAKIHPSAGRRIQYLKMLELYQQGKIAREPQFPPEQDFMPRLK
ncbi:MAG TPA: hypothetical protein VGF14_01930 [Alphaproteobacteria bacterium]